VAGSSVSASPSGPATFDIFAPGPDFLIYQSKLTAVGPSGWTALGGGLLREPIAASAPDRRYHYLNVQAEWRMCED